MNLFDYSMSDALNQWAEEFSRVQFEQKVGRVWMKCRHANKHALADKIKAKYPKAFQIKSDMAIAMMLSLTATKMKH